MEREKVEDEHEAEEHRERQEQVAHVELKSAECRVSKACAQ